MASSDYDIRIRATTSGAENITRLKRGILELNGEIAKTRRTWAEYTFAIGAASAAAYGAVRALKGVYSALREGAALQTTTNRFNNLTQSIGTTADIMLTKLREATRGMMTDAELMASASQMMTLKLAATEDQVVRLTTVAGVLGWDMQQLILTFANLSKMRLDALGLSVEEVVAKQRELMRQGMSEAMAFKEAVVQAGEARLDIMGLSDTELALQQVETAAKNVGDAFKLAFAEGAVNAIGETRDAALTLGSVMATLAPTVTLGAETIFKPLINGLLRLQIAMLQLQYVQNGGGMGDRVMRETTDLLSAADAALTFGSVMATLSGDTETLQSTVTVLNGALDDQKRAAMEAQQALMLYGTIGRFGPDQSQSGGLQRLREQATATANSADELREQFVKWERQSNVNSSATLKLADGTKYTKYQLTQLGDQVGKTWYQMKAMLSSGTAWVVDGKVITDEIAQANEDAARESARRVREQHREAAMAMAEEYKAAARAASEAFMAALQPGGQVNFGDTRGMKQAALDMAGSFGLTVPILADIGTQLGVIDQKTAESAIKAALYKDAMGTLFGMLQSGTIDTSEFVEAFDNLIADLSNKSLVDIQVGLKVKQGESIQLKDILPDGVRMPDGNVGFSMPVELSPEEEALNQALDNLDGVQGDASLDVMFKPLTSAVDEAIQNYRNASVNVRVNFTAPGIGPDRDGDGVPDDADNYPNDPTRRQLGGPVRRGKSYLVGEAGPELFVPGMNGFVVSNNNMKSGPGNMSVTINVSGSAAQPERVGAAVKDAMTQFWSDLRFEGVSW